MEFLDDEAEVSQDEEDVLLPNYRRGRNRKRRRTSSIDSHSVPDDTRSLDFRLPSNNLQESDSDDESEEFGFSPEHSKYEKVMHIPENPIPLEETYVSQLSQPWSSPSRIRGPRWKKSKPSEAGSAMEKAKDVEPSPAGQQSNTYRSPVRMRVSVPVSPSSVDEFDDDDFELLNALAAAPIESESQLRNTSASTQMPGGRLSSGSFRQTTLFGLNTTQREVQASQSTRKHNWPLANRKEKATHHVINEEAMKTWVYPTNLGKIRDYQYNIVHKGLFNNLLVALPTGLGKTFIAATVMLNWYRWTKDAQLVFVAPTRPLVVQQAQACYGIAGIPKADTTIMTGGVTSAIRAVEWQEKRVFFMTPQTLENDLKSRIADAKKIVLLVVDEAHKATGEYSYVKVVRLLRQTNESFRVLALTATPGSKVESVQNVIDSLGIARVEIRTEDSLDIREFVHSRDTQLRIFDPSEELEMCLELFDQAVTPVLSQLISQGAYHERRPTNMNLYSLKMARDRWAQSAAANVAEMGLKMKIRRIFEVLMSLAHSIELLKFHGIGPFFQKMVTFETEAGSGKYVKMILDNEHFKKMMNYMRSWTNNPDFEGHPKLTYLKEVVLNHFLDAGEGRESAATENGSNSGRTRIMVFAHYRESAEEIQRLLRRHEPMIRSHVFVGQSSTKGSGGMNQKTQLDIIDKFKSGVYNTLVATSIGEEGLDIGEVDLIVCYDSSSSPIRMLQRMGRTGRKRAGRIELLLMRGKEENNFYKAKDNYQRMQEIIESGTEFSFRDDQSPRIVPKEIQPVVDKRIVDIPVENTQPGLPEPGKRRGVPKLKRPPKKFDMPEGVDSGFVFVGGKKRKPEPGKKKESQPRKKSRPVLDRVVAAVPPLERVLLTAEQEAEFDHHYRQVLGTEPQYIQVVRFDAFPESQKQLQRTFLVGHSRHTKNLTLTIQKMNEPDQDWRRPTEDEIMQTQALTVGIKTVDGDDVTSRCYHNHNHDNGNDKSNVKPRVSKSSRAMDSSIGQARAEAVDEYDERDSFIDDEDDDNTTFGQRKSSFSSPPVVDIGISNKNNSEKDREDEEEKEQRWYVSQKSIEDDVLDIDDELPDFGQIMERVGSSSKKKAASIKTSTAGQARRRVIDSDDEE